MSDVARLVEAHRLEPHPEGGWYRRTWTAPEVVAMPHGERHTASAILFLLDRDEVAAWHVVRSDELWFWHGPGTLEVTLGGTGERPEEAEPIVLDASSPQLLVPAGGLAAHDRARRARAGELRGESRVPVRRLAAGRVVTARPAVARFRPKPWLERHCWSSSHGNRPRRRVR